MQDRRSKAAPGWRVYLGILAATLALGGCERSDEARRRAVYDLGRESTAENISEIRGMLSDPSRDVRATALNALVQLRVADAVPLAARSLFDDDGFVRATAAKLLGDLGDAGGGDALARVLGHDPEAIVRQRCAESLGRIGSVGAAAALIAALDDEAPKVRQAAVESLRTLASPDALERVAVTAIEDPSWEVRVPALSVLGASGEPAAEDTLRTALEDGNEYVRAAATQALRVHEQVRRQREASAVDPQAESPAEPEAESPAERAG